MTYGQLMTKQDVCEQWGVKESWLNAEIAAGRMPHLRLGKRKGIRFTQDHLDKYLADRESEQQE